MFSFFVKILVCDMLRENLCDVLLATEFDRPDECHHVKVLSPAEAAVNSSLLPTGWSFDGCSYWQ